MKWPNLSKGVNTFTNKKFYSIGLNFVTYDLA